MVSGVDAWKVVPEENATSDPLINWQEGQLPSTVNDSARAMMARIKEEFNKGVGNLSVIMLDSSSVEEKNGVINFFFKASSLSSLNNFNFIYFSHDIIDSIGSELTDNKFYRLNAKVTVEDGRTTSVEDFGIRLNFRGLFPDIRSLSSSNIYGLSDQFFAVRFYLVEDVSNRYVTINIRDWERGYSGAVSLLGAISISGSWSNLRISYKWESSHFLSLRISGGMSYRDTWNELQIRISFSLIESYSNISFQGFSCGINYHDSGSYANTVYAATRPLLYYKDGIIFQIRPNTGSPPSNGGGGQGVMAFIYDIGLSFNSPLSMDAIKDLTKIFPLQIDKVTKWNGRL